MSLHKEVKEAQLYNNDIVENLKRNLGELVYKICLTETQIPYYDLVKKNCTSIVGKCDEIIDLLNEIYDKNPERIRLERTIFEEKKKELQTVIPDNILELEKFVKLRFETYPLMKELWKKNFTFDNNPRQILISQVKYDDVNELQLTLRVMCQHDMKVFFREFCKYLDIEKTPGCLGDFIVLSFDEFMKGLIHFSK